MPSRSASATPSTPRTRNSVTRRASVPATSPERVSAVSPGPDGSSAAPESSSEATGRKLVFLGVYPEPDAAEWVASVFHHALDGFRASTCTQHDVSADGAYGPVTVPEESLLDFVFIALAKAAEGEFERPPDPWDDPELRDAWAALAAAVAPHHAAYTARIATYRQ